MTLSPAIRKYFWDINPQQATPAKYPHYYMTRILEKGDTAAVDWLLAEYGQDQIKMLLPSLKLSPKSANYWRHYFHLT